MGPLVVLVGPPGAGKTTIGQALAVHLDVPFRDTDHDVEAFYGRSIADIFIDAGEAHFRALERRAVERALLEHQGVLSLGGGAVLDEGTRWLLRGHRVVFLSADLASASARVGLSAARPVLALNPRAQLQQLLAQRLPLYREVADLEVSTDRKTPEQVVEEVLAAVRM